MFTRCRSLCAAEEIKVKQNKGERGRTGITGSVRHGDKEVEGGEEERNEERWGSCWVYVARNALCQGCFVKMWEVCNQSHSNVLLHGAALHWRCTCTSTSYTKYTADAPQPEKTHTPAEAENGYTINAEHGDKHHETNELFDSVIFLNMYSCPPRDTASVPNLKIYRFEGRINSKLFVTEHISGVFSERDETSPISQDHVWKVNMNRMRSFTNKAH